MAFVQLNLASISDSSVARLWVIGLNKPERLTDLEAVQFSFYLRGVFNQFFSESIAFLRRVQ